jgi:hypothetical protein
MRYLHNQNAGTWIANAVAIAVLIAILLAALFVLDLGSAVSLLGTTVPERDLPANPDVAVAEGKPASIATLLINWEYTGHCQTSNDCTNCIQPPGSHGASCGNEVSCTISGVAYNFPVCCFNNNNNIPPGSPCPTVVNQCPGNNNVPPNQCATCCSP